MKIYLLDACFVINLLVENCTYHKEAYDYFVRLSQDKDVTLKISTLAVAEFAIKEDICMIPNNIQKLAYNCTHAAKSGDFGKVSRKCLSVSKDSSRAIVLTDVKMFAQAEVEGIDYFITADHNILRAYNELKEKGLVSFEFVDITTTTCASFYGEFDFQTDK